MGFYEYKTWTKIFQGFAENLVCVVQNFSLMVTKMKIYFIMLQSTLEWTQVMYNRSFCVLLISLFLHFTNCSVKLTIFKISTWKCQDQFLKSPLIVLQYFVTLACLEAAFKKCFQMKFNLDNTFEQIHCFYASRLVCSY